MIDLSTNLNTLSPAEKRALLAKVLQQEVSRDASTNATSPPSEVLSSPALHPYEEYVNPYVGRLLRNIAMDKRYVRGEGCWLEDEQGVRYLDFTAAYGALPFGFNPPEIWEAIKAVGSAMEPSFVQPSTIVAAGELGRRLIELGPAGLRYVTFVNSGTEAVEASIKLARAARGCMGIVSTEHSFHGKTLGALSATGRTTYQSAFGAPVEGFMRVPFGKLEPLKHLFAQNADEIAAFIVEPIQGEGGVRCPPEGYLQGVRDLCTRHGVLLILDEVQTGLGRTGSLFACEHEGVTPDILTLAKALGGGVVPAGAVLCSEEAFTEEFAMKHTSTFANNTLSCRVGLRSLELLTRNNQELIRQVKANGDYLKAELDRIRRLHPQLIESVRGRGYLLGVEFTATTGAFARQCLMDSMAVQETLVMALCSYMLNVEHIRLAPTLFGSRVMRIEPALIATLDISQQFVEAFERMMWELSTCNTAKLFSHVVGRKYVQPAETQRRPHRVVARYSPQSDDGRFAFIVHPLDLQSYRDMDEGLASFTHAQLQEMMDRLNTSRMTDVEETIVIGACRVKSETGRSVYGEFLGLTHTAEELLNLPGSVAAEKVRSAITLARARGAQIVGLGGFSSIVTGNGVYATDLGVPLTTGNSYTVACAVETLKRAAAILNDSFAETRLAVVGATGSIGGAAAILLSEAVGRMVLVGNSEHPRNSSIRLEALVTQIVKHLHARALQGKEFSPGSMGHVLLEKGLLQTACDTRGINEMVKALRNEGRLQVTTDNDQALREADYVMTATSSTKDLVTAQNLKPGSVVCDISRPSNVSQSLRESRPDVLIVDGGVVELPNCSDLGVNYGLSPGLTYACMAETMILALEQRFNNGTVGADLDDGFIRNMQDLANKHRFVLGDLQCSGRVLAHEDWNRIAEIRKTVKADRRIGLSASVGT